MKMIQSTVGSDPDVSIAIFKHCSCAEVGESIAHLIIRESVRSPVTYPFVGRDPHGAIPALQQSADELVHQPLFGSEFAHPVSVSPYTSFSVRTYPKRATTIAVNVSHRYVSQFWKDIGF